MLHKRYRPYVEVKTLKYFKRKGLAKRERGSEKRNSAKCERKMKMFYVKYFLIQVVKRQKNRSMGWRKRFNVLIFYPRHILSR